MAVEWNIGSNGELFVGEDKRITFQVLSDGSAQPLNEPVNILTWLIHFVVRKSDASPALMLEKQATLAGIYNIDRALNTQRAVVTLEDVDLNLLKAKTYRYSLKRMDEAAETILFYGNFTPQLATAR